MLLKVQVQTVVLLQVSETRFKCRGAAFSFFHDFLITTNYYIVLVNSSRMDYIKLITEFAFGHAGITDCMSIDPSMDMQVGHTSTDILI
jgi:carotenoid cleavage dioxygenase-like enzyme